MAKITFYNLAHSDLPHPMSGSDFALKDLNLVWADGEAYALLGSSGCGKSALLIPSQGRVLFDDRDVTTAPTADRNIAQVFQCPVVYDAVTVRENLAFPIKNKDMDAAEVRRRVQKVGAMIDMGARLDRRARGLTANAKQKISLGRGMVREDVNALLFDELLTVIDPHMKWECRTQIKTLHQEFGHTMIYVTHDQTAALTFAEKVVVMYDRSVVQIGTPQALFECPAHTFVAFFAVIYLITMVNYSAQDTFGNNQFFWASLSWFDDRLHSERMWTALGRQLTFSAIILAIEVPLGICVALNVPKGGFWSSFCLVTMSLLIPWKVVGTIWLVFGRVEIGKLGHAIDKL